VYEEVADTPGAPLLGDEGDSLDGEPVVALVAEPEVPSDQPTHQRDDEDRRGEGRGDPHGHSPPVAV
jgi:hypothetical protein